MTKRLLPILVLLAAVTSMAQLNRVGISQIVGTLTAVQGGTGQSVYAIGDLLSANTTTTLSRVAAPTAGKLLRGAGANTLPAYSTATFPDTATTGDLLMASGSNVWGVRAGVATGQVLASGGVGTAPAYTATPSVTSATVLAGGGATTMKVGGILCSTAAADCSAIAYTDAATVNQWNVMSLTLPASALATNGDLIKIEIAARQATNANAKAYQLYLGGGTCSGTGASCCASGTQVFSIGGSGSNTELKSEIEVQRTGASTQSFDEWTNISTTILDTFGSTASLTDTNALPMVFCARNTAASATTLQGTPTMRILYFGK